jgi:hypothetical protein
MRTPSWSPDHRAVAFAALVDGNWDIYTVGADGGALTRVTTDSAQDESPRWTPDGRIVFTRGPFSCPCEAWIVDADGTNEAKLPTGPGNALHPEPAPSGTKLAFANDRNGHFELYTMQFDGTALRRITTGSPGLSDFRPRWSPRGNDIAFVRETSATDNDLFLVHANGTGLTRLTATQDRAEEYPSWSPAGDEILFMTFSLDGSPGRLHAIRPDGTGEAQLSTAYSAPLSDDFGDGVRDGSLWHVIQDPGSTIADADGRLEVSIDGSAVPGGPYDQVDAHYGFQCTAPGDYDAQVDFELLEWPTPGGFYAGLNAIFADAGIWRHSGPWGDDTSSWVAPNALGIPFTPAAGSFRIVRSGGVTTTYVRAAGGDWIAVGSGSPSGAAVFAPQLSTPSSEFQHLTGRVAFDNFRLNSGGLVCPSWWSDGFPDY